MFRHDPQHTGRSPYKGNEINMFKWKFSIRSNEWSGNIDSSPAIGSDGTIYVLADSFCGPLGVTPCECLWAINPNGTLKWKGKIKVPTYSSPAIGSDGTIYVGSDGTLYAINPNGKLKWKLETEGWIYSSPTIGSDGTIYVGGSDHTLYAINPNGKLKWKFGTGGKVGSSPAISSNGTIYFWSSDGYFYAINPNGILKWKLGIGNIGSSSPAIGSDGTIYVVNVVNVVRGNDLCAINPNGTLKWKLGIGNIGSSSPAIGSDGTIYIGLGYPLQISLEPSGYLAAINPNGTSKWMLKIEPVDSSPTIGSDGTIYIGSTIYNGWRYLYAINPNGSIVKRFTIEGSFAVPPSHSSSPVIGSDGTIYIGSNDGNFCAISGPVSSPQVSTTTYSLTGSLHCPDTRGYPCNSCGPPPDYENHFKGFNVLTTNEDCYVKLIYNNGAYMGNQNNCEVTIKGEKWLGLEDESGTKLVEEINKGNFDFTRANKFIERTMNFPGDNYKYEFTNEGREFRLYLSRNREEAFKAVPWKNITVEIKNKETKEVFKYKFQKGIFPQAYSWSNGGVANYGQCVWWAAKRWVEEVDAKTLFPFYPPSPQAVNVKIIDSNYKPKEYDVLIKYKPGGPPEHYGFVEKVEGDKMYISQFNWIKPGEVYNYIIRTWNGNATKLFYSCNPSDKYYFKYYYRRMSIEITPIFTDSFEGRVNGNNKLTSSFYQTIFSPNDISFVENGKIGKAVHFNSLSSYIGYPGKYINPDEGTIRFYFKPDLNFYKFYNLRQSVWKDYSTYKTPFGGFLIDTVAYLPAFTGSFLAFLGFSGDISNKNTNLTFGTWNGSSWSYAKYSNKDDLIFSSGTWYDFAFTWSKREGKTKIFIDGIEKADANFNTSLSSKEPFFIGENPFEYSGTSYWPYGPHSLIGTYDELRVYDEALDFKE